MSWQQFGFFVGVAFVAVWAVSNIGYAIGALVIGVIGFYIGRVLDGDSNVADLVDRFSTTDRR